MDMQRFLPLFLLLFLTTTTHTLLSQPSDDPPPTSDETPTNDEPSGAILLTVYSDRCSSRTEGTTGGTESTTHNNSSCLSDPNSSYGSVKNPIDVWYKAAIPSSGSITFELGKTKENFILRPVFVAYKKENDSYNEVECASLTGNNTYAKIELTNQSENDTIYLQVVDNNQIEYDNDETGSFNICAYEPSTLDFSENDAPMLSYYSNPVGNRLAVESSYQIQSLVVYDLVGRAVLSQTPNKSKLQLNTYALAPGIYLLRVQTAAGQQTVKLLKT